MTRRRKLWLVACALSGGLLLVTLGLVAWLALGSGTLWTLQRLDAFSGGRVQVQGAAGDLLGKFSARSITLRTASADVTLLGVHSEAAAFDGLFSVGKQTRKLHLKRLHIDEAVLTLHSGKTASTAPTSLQLPLDITIDALEIDRVRSANNTLAPLLNVRAALALQQDQHRITALSAQWDKLSIYGVAQVGTKGTLAVAAALGLAGTKAPNLPAWQAAVTANGALAELAVTAKLQAADQNLNATAVVAAWQRNPLPKLDASFTDWDVQRLVSAAPRTALTGNATVALVTGYPLQISVTARNGAAGPLNLGLLPLQRLNVQLEGAANRWSIKSLVAELASGDSNTNTITGSGQWQDGPWALDLALGSLALQQLDARWPAAVVAGSVRASGVGTALSSPIKLQAQLQGRLQETAQAVPLSLEARAAVQWPSRVTLEQFTANAGAASLTGKLTALSTPTAKVATSAPWQIDSTLAFSKLSSQLLAPQQAKQAPGKTTKATNISPQALQNTQPSTQLSGSATARFSFVPGAAQPLHSGSANVTLSNSQIAGLPSSGRIDIAFAPLFASLANPSKGAPWWASQRITSRAALQLASNRLGWDGAIGAPADVLSWTLDAPQLSDISNISKTAGAAGTTSASGALSGSGQFAGVWPAITSRGNARLSQLQAAGWAVGSGTVSWQAALADNAPLTLELALQNLRPAVAELGGPSAPSTAVPTVIEKLTVSVSGSAAQHRISTTAVAMRMQRRVEATASVSGAARNLPQWLNPTAALAQTPLWQATVQTLQVQEQLTSANAANNRLLLQAAPFDISWSRAQTANRLQLSPGSAQVPALGTAAVLRWQASFWQPGSYALSGELAPVTFDDLRQLLPPDAAQGLSGDLQLAATFALQSAPTFGATVAIKRLSGDLLAGVENDASANLLSISDTALGLTDATLNLSVTDGLWRVTHTLAGTGLGRLDADVSTRAVAPNLLPGKAAPASGTVTLAVQNVAVWNAFLPAGWRMAGGMRGNAALAGTLGAPHLQGSLDFTSLVIGNPLLGVDVKNGRGSVVFNGTDVRLQSVQFAGGSGLLALEGSATLGDSKTLRLSLNAERFALLARIDRQAVISGKANLALDDKRLKVDGKLRIDSGLIDISQLDAPSLSDDVIVTRKTSGGAVQVAQKPSPASPAPIKTPLRAELALTVDLGERFRVKGRGVDTLLRGQLALSAPSGRLVADGTLSSARGTYAAYGQRLEIERGAVSFSPSYDLGNPRLDVLAIRPNMEQRVGVAITGTAQAPRIKLHSEPEVPDTEKLAMLVLGRGFDGLSRDDTALIQQAALALLAGEDGGITGSLSRTLGLDTIALGARGTDVRETVVTLGKQISRSVYVGYERGLNSTTGTWQLIYRISNRFTLRAQAGSDSTLDLIWSWKWQ